MYFLYSGLEVLSYGGVTFEAFASAFPDAFSDFMQDKVLCERIKIIGIKGKIIIHPSMIFCQ